MNPGRSEILTLLRLISLKSYDEVTDIAIQNILKYSQPFELIDDLQIPYVGYVKSLISDSSGAIKTLTFSQSDLVSDGGGSYYLPINLTGTQITIAMKSTGGHKNAGGDVETINGFTDNSAQVITVFVVGEASDDPTPLSLTNTTDRDINYFLNGGVGEVLLIGQSIDLQIGDVIVMALSNSSSSQFYFLRNGFPFNSDIGDNLPDIDTTYRRWTIPSGTTTLEMIGGAG